ncbi:monoglyceride lipase isoform X2 [Lingula anatina]|uniref:Monoglyceride lipase isoform X2 n=1 Tax=Lingula anatina TaxID=7574 RepID=A0A1S3IA32_LINAN|nr:monoglyceride lipase isoform X2 [Lingula anatina]|eukprot:XP_013395120.1 monoglyceride lipase isoform X2 [Lingula anatina]
MTQASEKQTPQGVPYSTVPHFVSNVGHTIFCKYWDTKFKEDSRKPRALLFIAHGLNEHCLWYDILAEPLADKDVLTFSHDSYGHGQSEGTRVDLEDWSIYIKDIFQHCDEMKEKYPDIPLFLLGHSLGGAMAITATLERPDYFRGMILIAPSVVPHPDNVTPFKLWLAHWIAWLFPQMQLTTIDRTLNTRAQEMVEKYNADPLVWQGGMKARFGVSALKGLKAIEANLHAVTTPFLVLHGTGDRITDHKGSEMLHEKAQSTDKTIKLYDGYYHQLHYEPDDDGAEVRQDIFDWILARIDAPSG